MQDAGLDEPSDHVISPIKGSHEDGAGDPALIRRVEYALRQEHMGAAKNLPLYLQGETTLEVLTNSVLYVLHEERTPMSAEERREWERAVETAAGPVEEVF